MEKKTRKKWIIGAVLSVLIVCASLITYEVISFNRDMRDLGQSLGELGEGLGELGEGLSKLNFSSDTTSDSIKVSDPSVHPVDTIIEGEN